MNQATRPTKHAPDVWDSAAFSMHFSSFEFFLLPSRVLAHPRRRPRAEIVGKLRNINIERGKRYESKWNFYRQEMG